MRCIYSSEEESQPAPQVHSISLQTQCRTMENSYPTTPHQKCRISLQKGGRGSLLYPVLVSEVSSFYNAIYIYFCKKKKSVRNSSCVTDKKETCNFTHLASVLHSEMAPDLFKVRPTMNHRSLLTLEVSGVPYMPLRGDHIQADSRDAATVPPRPPLLCIFPPPPSNKFQSELLFFRPSFILLNQTLCLSLLLYLPLVSMVTSLSALYTIYLFLRFPLCLPHSVLIFLILLSSLPPFLLLYPTPSSLRLLSLFTFICLSPFSPLQACHSIKLVLVLTYRRKVLSLSLSILHF